MSTVAPPMSDAAARGLLRRMLDAAVARADPARVLAERLPPPPKGRCVVVGAGKAAASMAAAVEAAWPHVPLSGVVVTPDGYGLPTGRIEVLEAAHPVPDARSEAAGRAILSAVQGLGADDLVLALISGGGSAVMVVPAEGLTLADKQALNRCLLASGLDIRTMNAMRRRLSAIKGGRLAAAAAPAQVLTLAISDIPGDDPTAIASGPTAPDPEAATDLSAVTLRLADRLPAAVVARLLTPPAPLALPPGEIRLIATPAEALQAAVVVARDAGWKVEMLGDALEGESRELAAVMAAHVRRGVDRPTVLISGGETTVTLEDGPSGRGGRNTEFLLALGVALGPMSGVWALAADTDGEDGACGAAGALLAPDSLARARRIGLDPAVRLAAHDSGGLFRALGDLVETGPTRTNINDFRAILIIPDAERGTRVDA